MLRDRVPDGRSTQCTSSYHHFPSVEKITKILTFFLKPGGALIISDILKDDGGAAAIPEDVHRIVPHTHGFSESDMRKLLEGAGLMEFEFEVVTKATYFGKEIQFFLTKAIKPM